MSKKWQVLCPLKGPGGWLERAPLRALVPKKISVLDFIDVNNHISIIALIAQLDRASDYESGG